MLTITQSSLALLLIASATSNPFIGASNLRQRHLATNTYTAYEDYAMIMLNAVNKQRATQGLSPLCLNKKLHDAAQRHSDDMAANDYMDHTGTDGSALSDRITDAGYDWNAVAENVAAGQEDVAAVMEAWINSPGHLENIMGDYTMFASAYAFSAEGKYHYYWTQDFASGDAEACDDTMTTQDSTQTIEQVQNEETSAPKDVVERSVTNAPVTEAPVTEAAVTETSTTEAPPMPALIVSIDKTKSKDCESHF
ncbi:RxLR-like protein [Plasmopara halstedii]|uniref:RxLR-like protein n=1 Tax=Plasmopara halstedii TaxID=4781 RepID=A0A0P1AKJ5_PLAHL|nr:RxLR-like protein [Plasmopara halstedii]CEG41784.1 RxLR-like protein [Plasmopara halstedii]|eukprot:XP_024578153.1 RxLR-like protein [Plasmopara halstedii]